MSILVLKSVNLTYIGGVLGSLGLGPGIPDWMLLVVGALEILSRNKNPLLPKPDSRREGHAGISVSAMLYAAASLPPYSCAKRIICWYETYASGWAGPIHPKLHS